MAVLPCNEEEIDWNVDMEVQLFHAMRGHKPVGVNRYFQMACIHEKFSNSINKEISSKQIWSHLDTMYDMAALHESEILPFPNESSDFDLPETEFGELISRKLDDLPLSQSLTPKGSETLPSKMNNNSNGATSALKTPKNVTLVKVNQNHSTPPTNKLEKDLIGQKPFVPLTPLSPRLGKSEIVKSETKSPRENNSSSKTKPGGGSPVVKVSKSISLNLNKSLKSESSSSSQKSSKQESTGENISKKSSKSDTPNSKKHRSESSDSSAAQKKLKNESDKKSKAEAASGDTTSIGKKISKVESVNGTKKQKLDSDGVKKSVDSAGPKHSKAEGKSNQPSTPKGLKGEDDSSSSTAASSKSSKTQGKGDGSDNSNKRKRQKLDEKKTPSLGSSTPVTKRRRT